MSVKMQVSMAPFKRAWSSRAFRQRRSKSKNMKIPISMKIYGRLRMMCMMARNSILEKQEPLALKRWAMLRRSGSTGMRAEVRLSGRVVERNPSR